MLIVHQALMAEEHDRVGLIDAAHFDAHRLRLRIKAELVRAIDGREDRPSPVGVVGVAFNEIACDVIRLRDVEVGVLQGVIRLRVVIWIARIEVRIADGVAIDECLAKLIDVQQSPDLLRQHGPPGIPHLDDLVAAGGSTGDYSLAKDEKWAT